MDAHLCIIRHIRAYNLSRAIGCNSSYIANTLVKRGSNTPTINKALIYLSKSVIDSVVNGVDFDLLRVSGADKHVKDVLYTINPSLRRKSHDYLCCISDKYKQEIESALLDLSNMADACINNSI